MGKNSYGLLTRLAGGVVNYGKRTYKESNRSEGERISMSKNVIGKGISPIEYEKAPSKKERSAKKEWDSIDFI